MKNDKERNAFNGQVRTSDGMLSALTDEDLDQVTGGGRNCRPGYNDDLDNIIDKIIRGEPDYMRRERPDNGYMHVGGLYSGLPKPGQ